MHENASLIPGIIEKVKIEDGTAFISPGNVINIVSGSRNRQGLTMIIKTPLKAASTGMFLKNHPIFSTNSSQSVRLMRNGEEFVLPNKNSILLPSVK